MFNFYLAIIVCLRGPYKIKDTHVKKVFDQDIKYYNVTQFSSTCIYTI